jgi:hypothetical protein
MWGNPAAMPDSASHQTDLAAADLILCLSMLLPPDRRGLRLPAPQEVMDLGLGYHQIWQTC